MFEPDKIRSYRQIKAPSELRNSIISLSGNSNEASSRADVGRSFKLSGTRSIYYGAAVTAACIVLMFAVIFQHMGQNKNICVFVNGVDISAKSVQLEVPLPELSLARELEPLIVNLSITLKEETHITVSSGILRDANEPDDVFSDLSSQTFPVGEHQLNWLVLPDSDGQCFTMRLEAPDQTFTLSLQHDPADDTWIVSGK